MMMDDKATVVLWCSRLTAAGRLSHDELKAILIDALVPGDAAAAEHPLASIKAEIYADRRNRDKVIDYNRVEMALRAKFSNT